METPLSTKRSLGILAHIDAGKTSLTERLLLVSGRIRQAGSVDQGTAAMDFLPVERERGITVKAAAVGLSWRGTDIRVVDTPGHVDFGGEVTRSVRVLDSAVVLLCGVAGLQSRTEAIHKALESRGLPRLYFINKLDRRGASFSRVYGEIRSQLDPRAVAVQYPLGEGESFAGMVDLVDMRLDSMPVPPELLGAAREARSALVEALAEGDEDMLAAYAEGREPGPAELKAALRRAVIARRLYPVLGGSAFADRSAEALLDAVLDYLPNPEEAALPESAADASGFADASSVSGAAAAPGLLERPFSAFVFKTSADETWGRLSWARVWSGRVKARDRVMEMPSRSLAAVRALFRPEAADMQEVAEASAGDIVAFALQSQGPKAKTDQGEGLGSSGSSLSDPSCPVVFETLGFPEPVVSLALEPRSRADLDRLREGLAVILDQDPSLRSREDKESGRVTLEGLGELHVEVAVERLAREFSARVRVGKPLVAYKEALRSSSRARMDFDRDENGEVLKAAVELELAPSQRGSGLALSAAPGLRLAPEIRAAIERGLRSALSVGPSQGYPVDDVAASVLDYAGSGRAGGRKEAKADERAAEIAAALAARRCLESAGSLLMEPWMRVELSVPEDRLGEAMQAIAGREGRIESVEDRGLEKLVAASAPLRALFGFSSELGSATAGRAGYLARFSRYEAASASRGT